jgi:2-oxoglutarate-dependent dioxygenase
MQIMEIIGLGQTKLKQSAEYLPDSGLDAFSQQSGPALTAEALMEGPSTLYMPFTAVKSGGGGGQFHFHQDNQYTRFDGPGINLWTALSLMTEENGCLQVVPRSHLNGTLASHSPDGDGHKAVTFEPEDFVSVSMESR